MKKTLSKFKVGDKVIYNKKEFDQDTGVIVKLEWDRERLHIKIWAKWNSNGELLHCTEESLTLVTKLEQVL